MRRAVLSLLVACGLAESAMLVACATHVRIWTDADGTAEVDADADADADADGDADVHVDAGHDAGESCPFVGATQCHEDVIMTCSEDEDDCLRWVESEDCGERGMQCADGPVGAACTCDACPAAGETRCNGDVLEMCAEAASGCLRWALSEDCSTMSMVCRDDGGEPVCSECQPVLAGLVSWYRGEGTADDEMGVNPGALIGSVGFSPGKVGTAFEFRPGSYVEIPASPSLTINSESPSTLEGWVRLASTADFANPLSICRPFYYGVLLWPGEDRFRPHVHDGVAWFLRDGTFEFLAGTWYHVVQVWDGRSLTVYIDGERQTLGEMFHAPVEWGGGLPAFIGKWDLNPVRDEVFWLSGAMDEVRIYSRALSEAEVRMNYSIGASGDCE